MHGYQVKYLTHLPLNHSATSTVVTSRLIDAHPKIFVVNKRKLAMTETQSAEISKLNSLGLGTQRNINIQGHWNQNPDCTAQGSWISTSSSNSALSVFYQGYFGPMLDTEGPLLTEIGLCEIR